MGAFPDPPQSRARPTSLEPITPPSSLSLIRGRDAFNLLGLLCPLVLNFCFLPFFSSYFMFEEMKHQQIIKSTATCFCMLGGWGEKLSSIPKVFGAGLFSNPIDTRQINKRK